MNKTFERKNKIISYKSIKFWWTTEKNLDTVALRIFNKGNSNWILLEADFEEI